MPWRRWQGGSYGLMGNQYCPTCIGEKGHHQLPWSVAIPSKVIVVDNINSEPTEN
jgi:hypothetical protein